ncbi:Secreted protein OS=Castellaniella defragrans OX=75697 GN=HNR28_002001 PE=4 SV=1 [Castellaniella defragrans]
MRWIAGCLLAGCCVISTGAWAAGTAVVKTGDRTLTVSFSGASARVDISDMHSGYLLLQGDKIYSVTQVNGQPVVLDAQSAAGLLGGNLHPSADMIQSLTRLTSTGGHETVAGQAGDVYTVVYRDAQGRTHSGQGVLGPQSEVRELTKILGHMAILLQSAGRQSVQGTQQVLDALQQRGLGLLAYKDQFRVEKISATAPAPGRLDLPAPPTQLPGNLGQLLQGLNPQSR